MNKKFTEYSNLNLSDINKKILSFWEEKNIFKKSVDEREGNPSFVFYEGPPSANGMPGIHHVMARTIKDVFCRYKTMQGFQVKRKAGWDTHGLPVELGVEKMLGITKEDIGTKISVEEYNAACRREVMKYTKEWEDLTTKMGYWVDMDDPYITYDNRYIETLWWLLKDLYNKDLLYKGYTIQPYSPAAGTGLSTHELNQPGCYRDVKDTTCIAMFHLPLSPSKGGETSGARNFERWEKLNGASSLPSGEGWGEVYFLAWTTTPWTLPSNTALAVGPNIDYVRVKTLNPYSKEPVQVILAECLLPNVMGKNEYEIIERYKGKELEGIEYEQLLPWVKAPLNPPTRGDLADKKLSEPYNTADVLSSNLLKENTKNRRKQPTDAENFLWKNISNKQLAGYKFRREHIIDGFIVDFVCLSEQLVVEVDGAYHNDEEQKKLDEERTDILNKKGFRVIRFTNEQVLFDIDKTLETIKTALRQSPPEGDLGGSAFRVILGDFVTTEDGTGIVHIAPTFGADDDRVAKQNGIPPLLLIDKNENRQPMVDRTGKFFLLEDLDKNFVASNVDVEKYSEFAGRFVKNAYDPKLTDQDETLDVAICMLLKQQGQVFKIEKHVHTYPHCWRTDKPVLYYPLDSWFIKTTACRDEMIALNETINWKPQSTGTGRFGKWLENLQDWNLSRSRYWGTPLPIWRTEDKTEEICIGSVEELIAEIEKSVKAGFMKENPYRNFKVGVYTTENYAVENIDLHRPYVDNIVLVSASGKPMKRELDLIDVWFDSGAMPFAQLHYPFSLSQTLSEGKGLAEEQNKKDYGYMTANSALYEILKENAKKHKSDPTQAEEILWLHLKGKKLDEYKFRRQHIIYDMIVDFVCLKEKLVIEVDGKYHDEEETKELDNLKTQILNEKGLRVIRFTNDEVLGNIDEVLDKILIALQTSTNSTPFPSGRAGDGLDLGGLEAFYPADFISEGVDQTRGWFFTLHAISTMVKHSVAFKNVISNGLVLDKNGNKMSKRLGNAVDPFITIEKYGSDPLRWYMMTNASPWDNLKFDIEGVEEVRRKFFGTLYNTYSFFALYANVDNFACKETEIPVKNRPEIDRWVISLLNTLVKDVTEYYETYEPTRAGRAISDFVNENLSNWYVRLNRKRYWGGEYDEDKIAAYQTLYTCLETVAKLMAPIAPFFAEQLFLDLHPNPSFPFGEGEAQSSNIAESLESANFLSLGERSGEGENILSVHLTDFPKYDESLIDSDLEQCMQLAQQISSMILALRRKADKKVRQPLLKAVIPASDETLYRQINYIADLVKAEVNIKELEVLSPDMDMENIVKKIKPNFKTLGKKYGKLMKEIAAAMTDFSKKEIGEIERNGNYSFELPSGEKIDLTAEDVEIFTEDMPGWLVANEGRLTVALDITVTGELMREGIARELVNRIQNIRKSNGYEIVDKIIVRIEKRVEINDAVNEYADYIATQTLANSVTLEDKVTNATGLDFDDYIVNISINKA